MKKMIRKVASLFVVMSVSAVMFAQGNMSVNVGYSGIIGRSTADLPIIGKQTESNSISGILVNFAYDWRFMESMGLNVGLDYVFSFDKEKTVDGDKFTGSKFQGHTLGIPVRYFYSLGITDDLNILFYGGPKFNFDLAGSNQMYLNGEKVGDPISIYDKDIIPEDLRPSRFNLLVGPGVGVTYKSFVLKGGYDFGVLDMIKDENIKARKDNWYVTLGFMF